MTFDQEQTERLIAAQEKLAGLLEKQVCLLEDLLRVVREIRHDQALDIEKKHFTC